MLKKINAYFLFAGIDYKKGISNVKNLKWFYKDKKKLTEQLLNNDEFPFGNLNPVLNDKFDAGGITFGHYFHQDLLIAQRIYQNSPLKHIDIASRIDGFVAHIAAFREIEVFDIRPIVSTITNITFTQIDITKPDFTLLDYADSISCLHAIEHFGLGRYNDPIDAWGHINGLNNIYKALKPGGKLYLSTPIGKQRIEFNAQRVFNMSYLIRLFKDRYCIDSFSYVDDRGDLHREADLNEEKISSNYGCFYGCGIFELTKL